MNVRMPDGTLIRNVPAGVTQEDLQEQYAAHSGKPAEPELPQPTEGGMEQFTGGIKHAGKEAYRGVKELVGGDTEELKREAEEYKKKPKGWQSTAGEFAGNVGMFAPLALVPGGLPAQVALAAGTSAATTPGGLEERGLAGALGGAGAGVGNVLTRTIGRAFKPIGTEAADTLALQARGVEPTFGQAMAQKGTPLGRAIGATEEGAMSVPIAGGPLRGARERASEQWRQATRQEAMPAGAGTAPQTVDEVTEIVGKSYDDLLDPHPMPRSSVIYQPDIRQLTRGQALSNEQRQLLSDTFEEIRLKHMQNPASVGQGPTAAAAQQAESELKTMGAKFTGSGDPAQRELGFAFGNLARDFGKTWRGAMPTDTRNAIAALDRQYPDLKAIQDAVRRTGSAASEGDPNRYSAAGLWRSSRRADRTASKRQHARGEAPQQELARLGMTLEGRLPESGTATRSMVSGGILGGSLMGGLGPGAIAGALALAGYGTRPIQQFLTGRAAPALQQAMLDALRRAAPGGAMAGAAGAEQLQGM